MTTFAIDLDFGGEPTPGQSDEAMLAEWVAEYAPGCTGVILVAHGPAGGAPIVRIESGSPEALLAPIEAYARPNGQDEVDMYVGLIERLA